RTIGGLAVHVHNKKNHPLFIREYGDLDFVVASKQRREFESFMPTVGYSPHKQFNILNGSTRQIYYHDESEMKIDIFVGDFEMCHKIPLENRLTADPLTIPLAELFLSKIQIIDLNQKDAMDIASLLLNVQTGNHDEGTINLNIISELCGNDWGLYKTTSLNLEKVQEIVSKTSLANEEKDLISKRIQEILQTFESMPKSLAWTLRDRVGTRVKWYVEVEEVGR
ncbi:MAG: hypothetical protein JNM46_02265, partial [Anaerolineales bacterium]|nr:hypothetical protein [Anaerolineales bacterium]